MSIILIMKSLRFIIEYRMWRCDFKRLMQRKYPSEMSVPGCVCIIVSTVCEVLFLKLRCCILIY